MPHQNLALQELKEEDAEDGYVWKVQTDDAGGLN